jgi:predicted adenylyl cyclase CyaB
MGNEREIKIKLDSEEKCVSVLQLCESLYGEMMEETQLDEYYDTPVEGLRQEDLTLRIRRTKGQIKIAMKSRRVFLTSTIHDRIELEFTAADEQEVNNQIRQHQLIITAVTEKHRWKFKGEDYKIVVDKLPFIGSFVEVEALTIERINEIIASLNLSAENAVSKNYSELLEEKLIEFGLPLRPNLRATFADEVRWRENLKSP